MENMGGIYKTLAYALSFILTLILFAWFFYSKGQANIQQEWDKDRAVLQQELKNQESKYETLFLAHKDFSSQVANSLEEKQNEYEENLSAIHNDFSDRMRNYETRVQLYQRQAKAGTIEQERLTSHAAELDRSLETGKRVAAELAATVRLRDEQLILLGSQIKADRAILESN